MASHDHHQKIPRAALYGAMGIVIAAFVAAVAGSSADVGAVRIPAAAAVAERDLTFVRRADGDVSVLDASNKREIDRLSEAGDGFARGVLRALERDRRLLGLSGDGAETRLTQWGDGRLSIKDLVTDREIQLIGFGQNHQRAFERLLNAS